MPALLKRAILTVWDRAGETNSVQGNAVLDPQAPKYLDRIEELVESPIRYVSVGTRRHQIIGPSFRRAPGVLAGVLDTGRRPRPGDYDAALRPEVGLRSQSVALPSVPVVIFQ